MDSVQRFYWHLPAMVAFLPWLPWHVSRLFAMLGGALKDLFDLKSGFRSKM